MLFNSIDFIIFLPIVFVLYWFATKRNVRIQNILLLIASYYFYACWNWKFLFLLVFSTLLDYFTGLKIAEAEHKGRKKLWLWISIGINLGFLGFFKYYNFFATSFAEAAADIGFKVSPWTLSVILPVGISFYTFHGLSYVIDIYKNRIQPERNFIDYSLFVSFFPLLVAGPIERATHLLPQIKQKRTIDYSRFVDGARQILWGLIKKVVIADTCADLVNMIFGNYAQYSGSTLVLGAVLFAFQAYGDFSGYSDIALGTARLFGIELLQNFSFPYFSRDIAEFWRRWHISLSSWFRDYLYIPLGGSKGGTWMKVRNTFIIFLVSGFWHGANWTYIIWGLLNALYIMPSILLKTNRVNLDIVAKGKVLPSAKEAIAMLTTFGLTVFSMIIFRNQSLTDSYHYMSIIFSKSLFAPLYITPKLLLLVLLLFFIIEWQGREQKYAIANFCFSWPKPLRWATYYAMVFAIIYFAHSGQQFIYFQF